MAGKAADIGAIAAKLVEDAKKGIFKSLYVLMGEEPFYPDMVCDAIIDNCIPEDSRDFNQTIHYGSDTDAETVISDAWRYPMMADRQLVVVKEAQLMKDIDKLSAYCEKPLDSTVLVILLHGAKLDGRKALYKAAQKIGVVLDSPTVRDYEITRWIIEYYHGRGLDIDPEAAQLLGEFAGTNLCTIAVETDKLVKNLPEDCRKVNVADIEKNVGVSRQYSVFELTKELSFRNAGKAMIIAERIGSTARFQMPMAVSALFTHFYRILKYGALMSSNPYAGNDEKQAILGVPPYFFKEYDAALRNYPTKKAMAVVSLLSDYDFKGKGGDIGPETTPGDILTELVTKILNT